MRYSKLFGKTVKNAPSDEATLNGKLLTQAGFIRREVAGVYNYLPLGIRVLNKISNIVREEMNVIGGQELLLSSLQNKQSWEKTGRWTGFDALFKLTSILDNEYPLGPTHEEVIVPLAKQFISSYKDLPLAVYQIQTKFRDEKRAKSGILRGREFLMKDLYSFHANEEDFNNYYEKAKKAYQKVFSRVGLKAIETQASGGAFSKFSHEYQAITDAGEDEIIYCPHFAKASRGKPGYHFSENKEIASKKENDLCPACQEKLVKAKAIEIGNIFPLGTKFSDAFGLTYKNKEGKDISVIMGCYGIGISRLMGTIVEVHHDDQGIVWPKEAAPYDCHLIHLGGVEAAASPPSEVRRFAEEAYEKLERSGIGVLYDDRDVSAGEKFADCDLIGIPVRLVVSKKTGDKIEWKERTLRQGSGQADKTELLTLEEVIGMFS